MAALTPKMYWPSRRSIGWFQAITSSGLGYFVAIVLKIARIVCCLVSSSCARYSSKVFTRWADVERVSAEIVAAAESGGWATGRPDPWYGARVTSPKDADRARGIVERLAGTLLDDIGARVRPVLEDAGLPIAPAADPAAQSASLATQEAATDETSDPGETVGHWVRAVETLDGVHRTLEIFRPEVFATDLREHILAAVVVCREPSIEIHGEKVMPLGIVSSMPKRCPTAHSRRLCPVASCLGGI